MNTFTLPPTGACSNPAAPSMQPRTIRQRHQALATCRACDVFDECETWLNSLPQATRPVGVVAGKALGIGRLSTSRRDLEREQRKTYARIAAQYAVSTYNETIVFVVREFNVTVRAASRMVARTHSLYFKQKEPA